MSNPDVFDTDQAGLLSDAAMSDLQLRQQPFVDSPNAGDSFADSITADQLRDIKEALVSGDDLLLVTGQTGCGKTTLLSQLTANSGARIQCFSVKGSARFSTHNLIAGMIEAFKRTPSDDLMAMLDDLAPCLNAMTERNMLSVIVLDDADHIPEHELTKLLSSMLYVNSNEKTLMRIALAADEAFDDRVAEVLPEGADLPYANLVIDPMSHDRAARYLEFRLNQAGYFDEFPFTEKDIAGINQAAQGNPLALHAIAADELNNMEGYDGMPPDLMTSSRSRKGTLLGPITALFSGINSKMALGFFACCLILGGLLLGTPSTEQKTDDRYKVIDSKKIETLEAADVAAAETKKAEAEKAAIEKAAAEKANVDSEEAATAAKAAEAAAAKAKAEQAAAAAKAKADAEKAAIEKAAAEAKAKAEQAAKQAAAAKPKPKPAAPDISASKLESPNWVLVQDTSQYTVQMSASVDRQKVEEFLANNPLDEPSSIFSYTRNGTTWHALVHGLFPNIEEARKAIERMPSTARSDQPWIRSIGRIQKALKEQN